MNETLSIIERRRSIRSYKPEQITEPELLQILRAGIVGPTAMNRQKRFFIVIQNKALLDKMVDFNKQGMVAAGADLSNKPDYHTFYHAPTVIMVCGEDGYDKRQLDCSYATENMALAAESLDIGSCIITSSYFMFTTDQAEALTKELGIPQGYSHICTIALGYKASGNPPMPEKDFNIIHYIR